MNLCRLLKFFSKLTTCPFTQGWGRYTSGVTGEPKPQAEPHCPQFSTSAAYCLCAGQLSSVDRRSLLLKPGVLGLEPLFLSSSSQPYRVSWSQNCWYSKVWIFKPLLLFYFQGEKVQVISQIELCFTKEDLHLRNCTEEPGELLSPKQEAWLSKVAAKQSMMVCEDGPVFYPPPKRTKNWCLKFGNSLCSTN